MQSLVKVKSPVAVNNQADFKPLSEPLTQNKTKNHENYTKKKTRKAMIDGSDIAPQSLVDAYWEVYSGLHFNDEGVSC